MKVVVMWFGCFLVVSLLGVFGPASGQSAGVGLAGEVNDVLLPGSELRVKPDPEGRSPVVVRITAAYPHGTAGSRYHLHWFAYEPGKHNLAQYLERHDGTPAGELPPVIVEAIALLPPGPPGTLPEFSAPLPRLGGYRTALLVGGCLWLAGLAGLLLWRRSSPSAGTPAAQPVVSLPDQLRALIDQARTGSLDADGRARLERLVLGFWRERLGLTGLAMPDAVRQLRDHAEAGSLLRRVEAWLHSGKPGASESDIAALLAPYLEETGRPTAPNPPPP